MWRYFCLVVALLGTAACAGPKATTVWTTASAEVTGVTSGPGATTVTLHVRVLAGRNGCSRDARIAYQEETDRGIFAMVAQDSSGLFGCSASAPADVTLTSKEPIGGRQLTLNQQAWVLSDGAYHRCDPHLGCEPPKDRCDPAWTRLAVRDMDVDRDSRPTVEACDGRWLIMTVPDDPAACGAEVRPGCELNAAVRRYFLRDEAAGWLIIARTTSGGCAAVLTVASTFPRTLCAGLAPTNHP